MKPRLAILFATFLAALFVPAAHALSQQVAKVRIPFAFYADGKMLPAGTYAIGLDLETNLLSFTDRSNDHMRFVAGGYRADDGSSRPQLVFDRVGDSYVLSEVETTDIGIAVPETQHTNPEGTSEMSAKSIPLQQTTKGK